MTANGGDGGRAGDGGGSDGTGVDWDALESDLRGAGYRVVRRDSGGPTLTVTVPTDVPALTDDPEGAFGRLLARLPGVRIPTDPSVIPADVRAIAGEYGAVAEVVSGNRTELHVAVSADGVL